MSEAKWTPVLTEDGTAVEWNEDLEEEVDPASLSN
jgi:hypothetical protein